MADCWAAELSVSACRSFRWLRRRQTPELTRMDWSHMEARGVRTRSRRWTCQFSTAVRVSSQPAACSGRVVVDPARLAHACVRRFAVMFGVIDPAAIPFTRR
jgi:hypothetical protein